MTAKSYNFFIRLRRFSKLTKVQNYMKLQATN